MLQEQRSETKNNNKNKNNFVRRNLLKTSRQAVMFKTHILSCVSNNKYGYKT